MRQKSGYITSAVLGGGGVPTARVGNRIRIGPQVGQSGYITRAVLGDPIASKRGANEKRPTNGPKWLHHLCRLGESPMLQSWDKFKSGPQVGT